MSETSKHKKITPPQSQELEQQKEIRIKEIKKNYSNPDFLITDTNLLKELEALTYSLEKLTPSQISRKKELKEKIAMFYGLENGLWTANLGNEKYYGSLLQMRRSLIKEYSCQTTLEFMLVDRIVASYWRSMQCDKIFNHLSEKEDGNISFDQLKINVIKEFNKGIELANRQLNINITLLKELKQPKLNVKVVADNAYVAQNQQIINTDEIKTTPKENH